MRNRAALWKGVPDLADRSKPRSAGVRRLLTSGRERVQEASFDKAHALFSRCLQLDPQNGPAMFCLSALERKNGSRRAARALLNQAAKTTPIFAPPRHDPHKPTIVRTRCIDSGNYCVSRNRAGGYKMLFKGGHFSLGALLDAERVNLYVANLTDGSAAALDSGPVPDLLLNTVACADRGQRTLAGLAAYLADRPTLRVLNHPAAVLKTTRDGNYHRLNAVDHARFPQTERLVLDQDAKALVRSVQARGLTLPLIARVTGRQTGREMTLCHDWSALEQVLDAAQPGSQVYLIQFVDCRSNGGVFRKARAFFIDGRVYPIAYLANDEWQIHAGDRYRIMLDRPDLQEEERRYLADPEAVLGKKAYAALAEVGRVLGLDYAGADFTVTPDGDLFVFEANPAMRHNFDHTPSFPYTRPYLQAVSDAFNAMVHARVRH